MAVYQLSIDLVTVNPKRPSYKPTCQCHYINSSRSSSLLCSHIFFECSDSCALRNTWTGGGQEVDGYVLHVLIQVLMAPNGNFKSWTNGVNFRSISWIRSFYWWWFRSFLFPIIISLNLADTHNCLVFAQYCWEIFYWNSILVYVILLWNYRCWSRSLDFLLILIDLYILT